MPPKTKTDDVSTERQKLLKTKLTLHESDSLASKLPKDDQDSLSDDDDKEKEREKRVTSDSDAMEDPQDDQDQPDDDQKKERKDWQALITPNIPLIDWAPSKPDRLHNGAFGKCKDNGRPVPYKLNGHIEIQRKFPWEKDD